MGETKWTPGPWHAIDRSPEEGLKIRGGGHHYPIAQAKSYWDGPGARREEALANLDLMAAAPDLYAAVEAQAEMLEASDDRGPWLQAKELRSLLARARGE